MADAAGDIWIANYGNSTLTELTSDGTALSPESGFTGGGISFPVGIAADAAGNLWVANQGANRISVFTASGTVLCPRLVSRAADSSCRRGSQWTRAATSG